MTGGEKYNAEFQIRKVNTGTGYFIWPGAVPAAGIWSGIAEEWSEVCVVGWDAGDCYLDGNGGPAGGGAELQNVRFYRFLPR
jgi:hypothetical protein